MDHFETCIIPSGCFGFDNQAQYCANPLMFGSEDWGTLQLCNPMPYTQINFPEAEAYEFLKTGLSRKQESLTRTVTGEEISLYAEAIVAIAANLTVDKPDVIIVPVRGALKPANQLKAVMAKSGVPFIYVPSQRLATSDERDEAFLKYLQDDDILKHKRGPIIRIAVLDTSMSGKGAAKYHYLLDEFRKRNSIEIDLKFSLIHSADRRPDEGRILEAGQLKPQIDLMKVDTLMVEDYDPALGAEVTFEGGTLQLKRKSMSGSLICRQQDGTVQELWNPDLANAFDTLLSHRVSDQITSLPGSVHLEDVWRDYMDH